MSPEITDLMYHGWSPWAFWGLWGLALLLPWLVTWAMAVYEAKELRKASDEQKKGVSMLLIIAAIFAFAQETWPAWDAICNGPRPYINGTEIQAEQMEAMQRLHELEVPGYWGLDPMQSSEQIEASCENYTAYRKGLE